MISQCSLLPLNMGACDPFVLENWIISCFSLRVGGWDGYQEGRCDIDGNSFFPNFPFLLNTHLLHSLYGVFHLTVQQSKDWGWVR